MPYWGMVLIHGAYILRAVRPPFILLHISAAPYHSIGIACHQKIEIDTACVASDSRGLRGTLPTSYSCTPGSPTLYRLKLKAPLVSVSERGSQALLSIGKAFPTIYRRSPVPKQIIVGISPTIIVGQHVTYIICPTPYYR